MIRGKIVGPVWSTRRVANLPKGALMSVELEKGSTLIAFDPIGCAPEQEVLVSQGSVAASYFPATTPIDAIIIGIIDTDS